MSDLPEKTDPRLEKLLRQWGAQEAAMQASQLNLPMVDVARQRTILHLRWAAIAATLVIAGGAAMLFVQYLASSFSPEQSAEPAARNAPDDRQLSKLTEELSEARKAASYAINKLAAQESMQRQDQLRIEELNATLVAKSRQLEATAKRVAALQTESGDLRREIARLTPEPGRDVADPYKLQEQLDDSRKELAAVNAKLRAASKELVASQREHRQAVNAARTAQGELAIVKSHQAADFQQTQEIYLAAVHGEQPAGEVVPINNDLRIRQEACKRARMVARIAALRPNAPEETKKLMDRLEVILTRLDTLNADDQPAVGAFRRLLQEGQVVGRIDAAMAANQPLAIRKWLFEAKLILAGAERVA